MTAADHKILGVISWMLVALIPVVAMWVAVFIHAQLTMARLVRSMILARSRPPMPPAPIATPGSPARGVSPSGS